MKKFFAVAALSLACMSFMAGDDAPKTNIPVAQIKNIKGESVSTATFQNDGKPMVISFWATWCKPCLQELNAIHTLYPVWQKETGMKLIAISIDDARNANKIAPFVKSRGWNFEVYNDANGDFKRVMNVNNVPHTFLLNGKGEIVSQHTTYSPGGEDELYEEIKKLVEAEKNIPTPTPSN